MFRTNRKLFYGIISCSAFLILFSVVQILLMNVAVPDITNIIISFSIPLTLLCGFALHYFLQANKYAGRLRIISLSGLTGLILLGAYGSIGAVNPVTTLFNKEDQEAITWINQNTSVNDKFLINSFYWGILVCAFRWRWLGQLSHWAKYCVCFISARTFGYSGVH